MTRLRTRRLITLLVVALFVALGAYNIELEGPILPIEEQPVSIQQSRRQLNELAVKGRASKTGYSRSQFGNGWAVLSGCDMRNRILVRDLNNQIVDKDCKVSSGTLKDPYTAKVINFQRGADSSRAVQIDHVVALSNAWQTGAQQLQSDERLALANDPLNLLAVDGPANEEKSDGDAATWLPANKSFRCQYVSRQISVKSKYRLWLTPPEKQAIANILTRCQ